MVSRLQLTLKTVRLLDFFCYNRKCHDGAVVGLDNKLLQHAKEYDGFSISKAQIKAQLYCRRFYFIASGEWNGPK